MTRHKPNFYRYSTKKCPNGWRCILNFTCPDGSYTQATGTGMTQNDALNVALERKKQKLNNRSSQSVTFRTVCEDWYNNVYHQNREGKIKSPSTFYLVQGYIKNYLNPDLGELTINQINSEFLENLALKWRKRNNNFRAIFSYVRMVFTYAKRKGYIKENPCSDLHLPAKRPPKNANKRQYFTIEECEQILRYFANQRDFRKYLFMWLVFQTGARRGEIIGLTWNNVDFKNGKLYIHQNSTTGEDGSQCIRHATKTASSYRSMFIDSQTLAYLRYWRDKQKCTLPEVTEQTFIIDNGFGQPVSNSAPDKWLRKAREALNLPSDLHIHSMRHSWATNAINNGMKPIQVQAQLGHSSLKTTLEIYTQLTESTKKKTPEQFNQGLKGQDFKAPWTL